MITSVNGTSPTRNEAGEDHPVLPEADDLARGDVARCPGSSGRARASRSGQPSVANGQSAEENQVSSTSVSRTSSPEPHSAQASGGGQVQSRCPSGHVQIGIWCPHQSWRETHQSGAFSSESIANGAGSRGGSGRAALSSAAIAGAASSSIRHHHCGETSGSIREWQRSQVGDRVAVALALLELAVLLQPRRRRARRPPSGQPLEAASAIIRPSGPITVSVARPWSRPISKSCGSWPG